VPLVLDAAERVAVGLPLPRSFELSKLWKKFCRTSCCDCPPVGLGAIDDSAGDVGWRPVPRSIVVPEGAREAAPAGRPDKRAAALLAASPPPVGLPLIPTSMSVSARSTVGRLKLLLPNGPTIPAAAVPAISAGFRK
jgi:hypothetical protein